MDFGFNLPTRGPLAGRESILALAKRGEELGYTYLALPDHIVIPRAIDSPYPYSATRKMGAMGEGDCLEQLTVMAFLAGATSKIRLLSSVMVVPHRPPVFTAKALATLDVLSQGRVTVGSARAGWTRSSAPSVRCRSPSAERSPTSICAYSRRCGPRTIPGSRASTSSSRTVSFLPKPVQKPHPPIWVGGESPPALRRTVALGDAWFPIGSNPEFPLNTAERFSQGVAKLHEEARRAGRDPATIDAGLLGVLVQGRADAHPRQRTAPGVYRQRRRGDQDIAAFRALGVRHLLFTFRAAHARRIPLGDGAVQR